jgi:linoleoyl-CoA desaturase
VHYRAISDIVKNTAEEFDIPYLDNPTFWGAVGSHIAILKYFGGEEAVETPHMRKAVA